jgi:hypothetical protein
MKIRPKVLKLLRADGQMHARGSYKACLFYFSLRTGFTGRVEKCQVRDEDNFKKDLRFSQR